MYKILVDALELTDADRDDGALFAVTFAIKDTKAAGSYAVSLNYDAEANRHTKQPKQEAPWFSMALLSNSDHQGDEQFVYSSFVQLLVDLSTHDPADDAAGNHQT